MSFIFHSTEQDGVLFYFHKCGTTNITTPMPDRSVYNLIGSSVYTMKGQTAYEHYNQRFVNFDQKKYVLVRHPMEKFISGYHHYLALIESNLDNKKDWMSKLLNRKFRVYDINLHCEAVRKLSVLNETYEDDYGHHCLDFYLHCVEDMGDHITNDMEVIRLGGNYETLRNTSLYELLEGKHSNQTQAHIKKSTFLNWTPESYNYITKKYKKTMKRLGYKYDH